MNRSNMPKQIMTFANGGLASFIPRQTRIMGQPHMLAYINPREEQILQDYRGNAPVVAGPAGVPSYLFGFDSIADMFDGGGKGGSGANFSTKSHSDYVRDNPDDHTARSHSAGYTGPARDADMFAGSNYTQQDDGSYSSDDSSTAAQVAAGTAKTFDLTTEGGVNAAIAKEESGQTVRKSDGTYAQKYADGTYGKSFGTAMEAYNDMKTRKNSLYQNLANILTPFDDQTYVAGKLVDNATDPAYAELLPPDLITGKGGNPDADGDGIPDAEEFATLYNAQSEAADNDPTGQSTGTGFIAGSDFSADIDGDGTPETYTAGTQYAVNTDGSVAVAGSEGDNTGGISQLDSALIHQGLAVDENNDGNISFDELTNPPVDLDQDYAFIDPEGATYPGADPGSVTIYDDYPVVDDTPTGPGGGSDDDTTSGGGDDGTDGGDDTPVDTGPPSSMNFRFFGGYQPRTREDVLVASPGADQPFVMPDDPRITPIFNPGDNIDQQLGYAPQLPDAQPLPKEFLDDGNLFDGWLDFYNRQNPNHPDYDPGFLGVQPIDPGMNYGGGALAQAPAEDMVNRTPSFAAGVTPSPGMPGQGQFATMQELMDFQQQYPSVNLIGEYQRLKALEGGAAQPVTLPQRGVASLMAGDPATEAMYQGIMS
jgi:hypothetical protein